MVMVHEPKPEVRIATDEVRAKALADLESATLAFVAYMTHAGHVAKTDAVAVNLTRAARRWQIVREFGENPDDAEALHRWQQERDETRRIRRKLRPGD